MKAARPIDPPTFEGIPDPLRPHAGPAPHNHRLARALESLPFEQFHHEWCAAIAETVHAGHLAEACVAMDSVRRRYKRHEMSVLNRFVSSEAQRVAARLGALRPVVKLSELIHNATDRERVARHIEQSRDDLLLVRRDRHGLFVLMA